MLLNFSKKVWKNIKNKMQNHAFYFKKMQNHVIKMQKLHFILKNNSHNKGYGK
jgi:hypothetical protein